jgi:Mlc titration factor MtfA (ptsG expression regulator)
VRSRRRGLPEDGAAIVARHLAVWQLLDRDERSRLLEITDHLLSRKRWEAARGFTLDDTVRVVIAAQAAVLVLALDERHYRTVSGIVVHPSTVQTSGERPGPFAGSMTNDPLPVLGLAQGGHGPVVLAWDQALAGAAGVTVGHNVVLHEFAHKLDMLDGTVDGTPVLPRGLLDDWVRVCTDVYDHLVSGRPRPPMRWYGATTPASSSPSRPRSSSSSRSSCAPSSRSCTTCSPASTGRTRLRASCAGPRSEAVELPACAPPRRRHRRRGAAAR